MINIISSCAIYFEFDMQPPRPPKVTRRPPLHDASKRQEEMGLKASSQHAAGNRQRSFSPEPAVADQSGYEPLQIYQHGSEVG